MLSLSLKFSIPAVSFVAHALPSLSCSYILPFYGGVGVGVGGSV